MVVAINITAIVLSSLALLVSVICLGMILGMKWSSHKIEWKPLQLADAIPENEDLVNEFSEPDEEFLKTAKQLAEQGRKKKEKVETDPLEDILQSNNF